MRFFSEWLTLFTMTAVVVGALAVPRGDNAATATPMRVVAQRADLTAAGIDDMPVGTARAVVRAKLLRAKPLPAHP